MHRFGWKAGYSDFNSPPDTFPATSSLTCQYLLEDLQSRAALQKPQHWVHPVLNCRDGNAGAKACWRVTIWRCGSVYHVKQQHGENWNTSLSLRSCHDNKWQVGQKFPDVLTDAFPLPFGKNIMLLHFLLRLLVISTGRICICFSACLFFLMMLINKSRLVLLRAVTLAPAGG